MKGRWVAIHYNGKTCFAQWEDVGPFRTDDWSYVFGNSRPLNQSNNGAGLDVSPAVRDFLGLRSGERCHWRFVDLHEVRPHRGRNTATTTTSSSPKNASGNSNSRSSRD